MTAIHTQNHVHLTFATAVFIPFLQSLHKPT